MTALPLSWAPYSIPLIPAKAGTQAFCVSAGPAPSQEELGPGLRRDERREEPLSPEPEPGRISYAAPRVRVAPGEAPAAPRQRPASDQAITASVTAAMRRVQAALISGETPRRTWL